MRILPCVLSLPLLLTPAIARPCTQAQCQTESLVPSSPFPANIDSILWQPSHLNGSSNSSTVAESEVHLLSETGVQIPVTLTEMNRVPLTYEVRPTTPLTPGEYMLEAPDGCEPYEVARKLVVTDTAPVPAQLGTLEVVSTGRERIYVRGNGGTCTDRMVATVAAFKVNLSAEAEPWSAALLYTTKVDGAPWAPTDSYAANYPIGSSWYGRGRDYIYSSCDETLFGGLSLGAHEVVIEARLPGSSLVLSTPPLMVELSCDVELTNPSLTPQSDEDRDLAMNANPPSESSSGCICVQRSGSWASFAVFFGMLTLVYLRRSARF